MKLFPAPSGSPMYFLTFIQAPLHFFHNLPSASCASRCLMCLKRHSLSSSLFLQQAGSSRVFSLFHPYIGQNGLPPGVKRALGWAEVAKKPISAHGLPSF